MSTHAIRLRAQVALTRTKLDQALARGADPSFDPALALRADQLTGLKTRQRIANTIVNLLDASDEPADSWGRIGSHPPLRRDEITAAREVLLVLAARLREPAHFPPQAIALAEILVWDSASPMYAPTADTTVTDAAVTALALMDAPRGWRLPNSARIPVAP